MSYDTQVPPAAPQQVMRNGLGTAALILGIIGTISGLIPLLFWLAGTLGLIALILGLVGKGRVKRGEANNKGVTLTGAILGLVSLILATVGLIITVTAVSDAVEEIDKAVQSAAPKAPKTTEAPAADATKDNKGKGLADGDSSVYDDDLSVTVSDPKPYAAGEYSGHDKGNKAYQVTVVIENGGKEKFEAAGVMLNATAGANGVKAEQLFDDKVAMGFEGTIMPGKKATITVAFDAPKDAKTLTVEVNPGFTYDASQWELKLG
ncbi:DUF4352 domain-containing protein [Streptomyces sp. NBC_00094]|uniref:DUF4352 domain-containing protein n=1 Tax=Streptomyces sp. NBC_00094 TaxID=2903620 RepID=UPI002252D4F1|nr:DUF4352 domain-containing protein [Streptomyces sp. NBC_00094]MCX5391159.1 DUF4352 domain-containing protein [Streptomyces sp. NBC_00094]